jgi:hypothetical protein
MSVGSRGGNSFRNLFTQFVQFAQFRVRVFVLLVGSRGGGSQIACGLQVR